MSRVMKYDTIAIVTDVAKNLGEWAAFAERTAQRKDSINSIGKNKN